MDSWQINNADGQWFLTTRTRNHIHGWHFLLLSLAQTTFNYENLGWEIKEQQYTVLNTEVKCLYWLQIPKLLTPSVKNKSDFWLQYLSSTPCPVPISPCITLATTEKSKIINIKAKSIQHRLIMKEIWIGGQCKHLKDISHLAYCQLCHPDHIKCDCTICEKNSTTCSCFCHQKASIDRRDTTIKNDQLHMVLCPKLLSFWCYIYLVATKCSITFPSNERLLVWALISSHMSNLQDQNQIGVWQNIYSIYIPIFYKNYYFPVAHNNILINKFNAELLKQLKIDHMIMTRQLMKVKHSDDSAENIEEKTIPIRSFFLKKWGPLLV